MNKEDKCNDNVTNNGILINAKIPSLEVADANANRSIQTDEDNLFQPISVTVVDSFGHVIVSKRIQIQ